MSFVKVKFDTKELEGVLDRAAELDMGQLMEVAAEDLVAAVVDRINSRGDGEWPPNKPSTIRRKRGGAAPMIDTGNLRSSIEPEHGDDFAAAVTGVSYVVYHLDGGPVIPKRNPFEVRDEVVEEIAQQIADDLAAMITGG